MQHLRPLCREAVTISNREPSLPASTSTGAEPDKPPGPSSQAGASSAALVPLAGAEEEDEMMQDVVQMAAEDPASGQDVLAKLAASLRPIEKYAVRFLEQVRCGCDTRYSW